VTFSVVILHHFLLERRSQSLTFKPVSSAALMCHSQWQFWGRHDEWC